MMSRDMVLNLLDAVKIRKERRNQMLFFQVGGLESESSVKLF